MGLSAEILDPNETILIWLRESPVMCCTCKNEKFANFMQILFYI